MSQYFSEWESVESFRKYLPENVFFPELRRHRYTKARRESILNTDRYKSIPQESR
jgi:hypothetical protein